MTYKKIEIFPGKRMMARVDGIEMPDLERITIGPDGTVTLSAKATLAGTVATLLLCAAKKGPEPEPEKP
jgi:hypothetical protein